MKIRSTAILFACAVLVIPIFSGAQENQPYGEVLNVRVTNVDIVAVDAKGNRIKGLTAADFELFEDGRKQEITNFAEVTPDQPKPAETPAAEPVVVVNETSLTETNASPTGRSYIFYIDNGTLSFRNRDEIFTGINRFVGAMKPEDQVTIVNWNGSLHVRVPWTNDRALIDATLKTLAGELGSAGIRQAEKQRIFQTLRQFESEAIDNTGKRATAPGMTYEVVESEVRTYAENVYHDIDQSMTALTKLLASLSGVPGKKVLILATESLPTQAAAEVFQVFENIRQRSVIPQGALGGLMPDPGADSQNPVGVTTTLKADSRTATPIGDLGRYNVSKLIEGLARVANATGVTVYAINPKGTSGSNEGTAGLQDAPESTVSFAESAQVLDGVNLLAVRTGGVAFVGAPADVALTKMQADLDSYYSIGYRASAGKSRDRKILVRSKRPGVTVRHPSSIYYRSLATEMTDRVISNHLQTSIDNPLGIGLQAEAVKTEGTQQLLPLYVVIPVDSLTLVRDDKGNMTGGFSVFTSTGDLDGAAKGTDIQSRRIQWSEPEAAQMKGRKLAFAVKVPMNAHPKQVSVGVIDHVSHTEGFALMKLAQN
jgi:VWFA-related protein